MITHTGLIKEVQVNEYNILPQYDFTVYTEPDGSKWVRLFHHNSPNTTGVFARTDDFEHGVYLSADKWFDMRACQDNPTYEFMVKQKTTSTATEVKYRWIQNKNPWTATYADVAPAQVTRITTSGYTNGNFGGIYKLNGSAYMVIANNNNGNWFGAMGAFSIYQNGIPGYPNTVVTTGYMDVYFRIKSDVLKVTESKLTKNHFWDANELIEY